MRSRKLDDFVINLIKDKRYSTSDLTKMLICSKSYVQKYSKILNTKRRIPPRCKPRKYQVNDNFFKRWTVESAYLLGFIAADGNVSSNRLTFSICIKDFNQLDKIKKILNANNPIKDYVARERYPQRSLRITSKTICEDLARFGVLPHKSLSLNWLSVVPNELVFHFIRGYFDGDGCLSIRSNRRNANLIILGTHNFLWGIKSCFDDVFGKPRGCISKKSNSKIFCYQLAGNICLKAFLDLVYSNSTETIRLDRKFNKYLEFINIINLR